MIPKPKYLENILEITKHKDNWIYCDVICECGSKQFVGYKNVLIKTPEQLEHLEKISYAVDRCKIK